MRRWLITDPASFGYSTEAQRNWVVKERDALASRSVWNRSPTKGLSHPVGTRRLPAAMMCIRLFH